MNKFMFVFTTVAFITVLVGVIWHPQPYNTEVVCFDKDAKIVFYASGHSPNMDDSPLIKLTDSAYKIKMTGKILKAHCNSTWGSRPPKGRAYWEPLDE
jgi:hypothetical protein